MLVAAAVVAHVMAPINLTGTVLWALLLPPCCCRPAVAALLLLLLPQVCVIVDEEGTEAAAVTAVVMLRSTAVMAPPNKITFDRPFLFMLVEDSTSTPLFVGTVLDPSKSN